MNFVKVIEFYRQVQWAVMRLGTCSNCSHGSGSRFNLNVGAANNYKLF
jgi:hypothetical protein